MLAFADASLWYGAWALSGFWLWLFTIAISGIMIGGVLYEEAFPAAIFLVVLVAFAHLTGTVDVVEFIANPLTLLAYLIPYLILGLVFCLFKYRFWLKKEIAEDAERYPNTAIEEIAEQYKPSRVAERLALWVIWWPICLTRLMLGDWLQAFVRYVVNDLLGSFFQSIWNSEIERIKQTQKESK